MRQVNLHEAKTHLSRLVAQAVAGEGVVICKAGDPLVRITRVEGDGDLDPIPPRCRLGLLAGSASCPTTFPRASSRKGALAVVFAARVDLS